ncbi:hypothetical protein LCGC14_1829620 [marine sediment metagenome]|uniref:NAD(P)-binding domain-containing protein n=1 Tax=marine sediment metagenome TaxID=412755 RepID=A0A0F9JG15_9ZZZZ
MKVLVTGATGFAGRHLCKLLEQSEENEVFGTTLFDNDVIDESSVKVLKCDLLDRAAAKDIIDDIKPDQIFHLAALASVADAWNDIEKVLINNILAQLNLLQAVIELGVKPRILVISTGEVYGAVDKNDVPINENTRLKPNNPYATSKVTQEFLGLQYFASHGIPVIIARSFNHSGPGQKGNFVIPAFASQIVDVEQGRKEPLMHVGNLEAKRDFLDVRDVVIAYKRLIDEGRPGEVYNVCSGKAVKIKDILKKLLNASKVEITVKEDSERMRPSDTPLVVGDNSKLKEATGWEPKIDINKTIKDTLNYLRKTDRSTKEKVV